MQVKCQLNCSRKRYGHNCLSHQSGVKLRMVPLNATARKALREYLATRPPDDAIPYLFASQKGGGMTGRAISRVVAECAAAAGLAAQDVTAHTLRHTFATQYLEQNPGQLVELAALLGHADLNTTAIYTQPSFEAVARKLEQSALNVDG